MIMKKHLKQYDKGASAPKRVLVANQAMYFSAWWLTMVKGCDLVIDITKYVLGYKNLKNNNLSDNEVLKMLEGTFDEMYEAICLDILMI